MLRCVDSKAIDSKVLHKLRDPLVVRADDDLVFGVEIWQSDFRISQPADLRTRTVVIINLAVRVIIRGCVVCETEADMPPVRFRIRALVSEPHTRRECKKARTVFEKVLRIVGRGRSRGDIINDHVDHKVHITPMQLVGQLP